MRTGPGNRDGELLRAGVASDVLVGSSIGQRLPVAVGHDQYEVALIGGPGDDGEDAGGFSSELELRDLLAAGRAGRDPPRQKLLRIGWCGEPCGEQEASEDARHAQSLAFHHSRLLPRLDDKM